MIKYFFYSSDLDEVSTRSQNIINSLGGTEQLLDYYKKHNSFHDIHKVGKNSNEELIAFCKFLINPAQPEAVTTTLNKTPVKKPGRDRTVAQFLKRGINPGLLLQQLAAGIPVTKLALECGISDRYLRDLLKIYNEEDFEKALKLYHEKKSAQWPQWYEEFLSLVSQLGRTPSMEETMKHLNLPSVETYIKLQRAAFKDGYIYEYSNGNEDPFSKKRETMLAWLKELAVRLRHTPSVSDLAKEGKYSAHTFAYYFGHFSIAQQQAGLLPNKPGSSHELAVRSGVFVSREMCIEDLKKLYDKLGRKPGWKETKEHGSYDVVVYKKRLGKEVTDYIDYKPNKKLNRAYSTDERQDMLDFLAQLAQRLDRTPTPRNIHNAGKYSAAEYRACFGSFHKAQALAGLKPSIRDNWNGPATREEKKEILLAYLTGLARQYGHIPTYTEVVKEDKFTRSMYRFYFGTFANAQKAAAIMIANEQNPAILKSFKSS